MGLLDRPDLYGHDRNPVPYPAGLILPVLFFGIVWGGDFIPQHMQTAFLGYTVASFLLLIVSFIDDRYKISVGIRLFIQILVAIIILASGVSIPEIRSFIGDNISLLSDVEFFGFHISPLSDMIVFCWILFLMNSMNWLDGVSGLTSSVSFISTFLLALTAYYSGQADMANILLIFASILFIFFLFDIAPAQILMGDSGSMFLGLSLAIFTTIAGGKVITFMIIFFAPLFDTIWTIIRRVLSGNSPFKGDLEHLHHKLARLFQSERKTVIIYMGITFLLGVIAFFLSFWQKIILLFVLICIFSVFEIFLQRALRLKLQPPESEKTLGE